MKTVHKTFCLLLLFLSPVSIFALEHSGKNLSLYGVSAISTGRGGTGVASSGVDLFLKNPAAIGELELLSIGLNYGTLPFQTSYSFPELTLAVPTSYGVMGWSIRYLDIPGSVDFHSGYGISFGMGKELSPHLLIGMSLAAFYGHGPGSSFLAGGTLGIIYRFDGSSGNGFGFFDPRLGLSVLFGYPFGHKPENVNFNTATAGYQFTFLRTERYDLTFYNEVTAYNYRHFPVSMGLEALLYGNFTVRLGGTVLNEYNYGNFTAGLGYRFVFSNINGSINYSLIYYRDGVFVHNIGVTFQYGSPDRESPTTSITQDNNYISPNNDGIQDYVMFTLDVEDKSMIKGWRLQILDESENIITEFRMSDRDITGDLTIKDFFARIFQKKSSIVVPGKILWDGMNANRAVVPDGKYIYSFNAWDEHDNIAALKKGAVYVDTTPPRIEVQAAESLFSPNSDGRKDTFTVTQKVTSAIDDVWRAGFKSGDGKIVRHYSWTGYEVPKKLTWDGKDDSGNDAPEGIYHYFVYSKDKAGNSALAGVLDISLTRKYETADIALSQDFFSFRKDKEISFFPSLSSQAGLETWGIQVVDEKKNPVRDITGSVFEKVVIFDGKNNKGKRLPDGKYFVNFTALFKTGNMPQSFDKRLYMDSTPPGLDISHSPGLFSPDGDNENDILTIHPSGSDEFGIRDWRIAIYTPSGNLFKTFEGKGAVPKELKWNGYSDFGEIVESAADYSMDIEAFDLAGNYAKSSKDLINVDILVLVTERGLKMQISNIEFLLGSSEILTKGRRILNRVADILQKYNRYKVVVEGHTDDLGSEDVNLDLSEKRAKAVVDYLIDKGIAKERLTFLGMGETSPLYPNTSEENRRRNRRVEFLLLK